MHLTTNKILKETMASLKLVLKYYKYVSLICVVAYCIYIVIDDYVFIERISNLSELGVFIGFQALLLLVYFVGFSFYFWLIAIIVIYIYHKVRTVIIHNL